jgi:hypothetical protein
MSFSLILLLTDLAQSPLARQQRRGFERILSVLRVACQKRLACLDVAPAQSDQGQISQRAGIEPASADHCGRSAGLLMPPALKSVGLRKKQKPGRTSDTARL